MTNWKRVTDDNSPRKPSFRGFLPFTEGASIEGTLEAAKLKTDGSGKGYFLIKAHMPTKINVLDTDSKTGQAMCSAGDVVGVRKTGATKVLSKIPLGTMVRVTYEKFAERTALNPQTQKLETAMYHYVSVDVYEQEENF
jgi:hypothetical protein